MFSIPWYISGNHLAIEFCQICDDRIINIKCIAYKRVLKRHKQQIIIKNNQSDNKNIVLYTYEEGDQILLRKLTKFLP